MENGGNDEHRPWGYEASGSTVLTDTYRKFVAAHYELVRLSAGARCLIARTRTNRFRI